MITAWERARRPAESALPITSAPRYAGLTSSLWMMPRSRSQIAAMPKKIEMNSTLCASTPGAMNSR